MAEATPLYNPNKGVTGRDGGPYLDEVEAREAEKRRAFVEDREPNLDNPPATAGIPLVTGPQLLHALNLNNNPSMEAHNGTTSLDLVKTEQVSEIPAEFNAQVESEESDAANDTEPTTDDSTGGTDSGSATDSAVDDTTTDPAVDAPADFPQQ